MKIEIGHVPDKPYLEHRRMPRFLFSLRRPARRDAPFFSTVGRLYSGYVGCIWGTRWFVLTIWIAG